MEKVTREYKIGDDIMGIIENTIYKYYNGKSDFTGPAPSPERILAIETGLGGTYHITNCIKERAINSGLVIDASDIHNMSVTSEESAPLQLRSFTIPFLANINLMLNTELDKGGKISDDSPYINGFFKSSYNYIIKDGENIVAELVCIGKLPVFEEELLKLVRGSKIAEKYDMNPTKVVKYIMNTLKALE